MINAPIRITSTLTALVGPNSEHLKLVAHSLEIDSSLRSNIIRLAGAADDADMAQKRKEQKERRNDTLELTSVTNSAQEKPSRDEKEEPT